MQKPVKGLRGLQVIVGLVLVSVLAGFIAWNYSRPHKSQSLVVRKPHLAHLEGLKFEPRMNLDTSGFQLFRDNLPRWSTQASLIDIGKAWQQQCAQGLALAEMRSPALEVSGPQDFEFVIAQILMANCEGKPSLAYELLLQLRFGVERTPAMASKCLYTIIYLQGVTSMRLGEDENCILCRGDSSCILPISAAARHTKPRGSRQAIEHFTEYLEKFPDDLGARWLLNLAHMTLGEHPEQVDPRFVMAMQADEDPKLSIGAFQEVGERAGVNRYNHAGGGIMDDFDNDGWLDIVTTCMDASQHMTIYRNDTRGSFRQYWNEASLTDQIGGLYCVHADFNNDGFLDIFIPRGAWLTSPIRPSLLMNCGDGTFADFTEMAGLTAPGNSNSAAWADFDNDGLLDLYVVNERQPNRVFRNRGDGTFLDVAAEIGLQGNGQPMCKAAVWIDFDNDGDSDLFLNYFGGKAMLFRNDRKAGFTDVTTAQGIDGPEKGFSSWAWDYDNDGWLDLFATCYDQTLDDVVRGLLKQPHQRKSNRLLHNAQGKRFENKTQEAGLDLVFSTMGSNFADFNNDGFLDMYLGTGEPRYDMLVPNRMFLNVDGNRFAEITGSSRTGHLQKGHSVACGDWNRDGQTDVFVETGGASTGDRAHNLLFQNPGHSNAWVTLRLIGQQSNRSALGARIKVVTQGPAKQMFYRHITSGSTFGANSLEQNIGLGQTEKIESLEIHWPTTGQTQIFRTCPVGRVVVIREGMETYETLQFASTQPPPAK